jgi:Lysylphosphatidylglycerol synthase TM region
VTPGRLGELFRAIHLDPQRKLATAAATVEERFCAVVVTVAAGMGGMLLQRVVLDRPVFVPLVAASVLFTLALVLFVLLIKFGRTPATEDLSPLGRVRSFLKNPDRGGKIPYFRLAYYSVAAHMLLLLQTALLFSMFGERDLLVDFTAAAQAFAFMLLLPFFIANIGLREYAFSFFLARADRTAGGGLSCSAVALGVATIILFINIILPAAIGLFRVYLDRQADQRTAAEGDHDNAT